MKENNQTVEYFIIGIPREIQGRIVFDEFYVALIDDIILQVLNQRGYWQVDTNLELYDYAMLDEDGDNEVIRKKISKDEVYQEMKRRRAKFNEETLKRKRQEEEKILRKIDKA